MKKRLSKAKRETEVIDLDEEEHPIVAPVIHFLRTPEGAKLANRIVEAYTEGRKIKTYAENQVFKMQFRWYSIVQTAVIVLAIGVATTLTIMGKFDTTISLFMGTVLGYIFGKKSG